MILELWTEPVNLDQVQKPLNPGAYWHHLRPVWQTLLGMVRHQAANQVLATGGRWASYLTGVHQNPVEYHVIGYAWYIYQASLDVYPYRTDSGIGYAAWLLGDLHCDHPIFVTEWRFEQANAAIGTAFADHFLFGLNLS